MLLLKLYSLLLTIVTIALAAPSPQRHGTAAHGKSPQHFFLRANCPKEPWHGRHIVALPTSHQIGLENFTVGPTTSPLKFLPIHLPNSFYALRGEGSHTSDGRAPFLVALKSTTGTRTASMAVLYIENPTRGQTWIPDACTEGYECAVDQWNFEDAGTDMVHPNLRFEGFEGRFQPMKDAPHGEGWHVYWKGDAGLRHPIALDLVPI